MALRIQILIPTWNRSAKLRKLLESLRSANVPAPWEIEILVVLNNCTDNSREVVESFKKDFAIQSLEEKRQGIGFARQKAIDNASGDYLLFLDDDVVADPKLLQNYISAIESLNDFTFLAGSIQPTHPEPLSGWKTKYWERYCSQSALGLKMGPLEPVVRSKLPWGMNFLLKRASMPGITFRSDLGHQGKKRSYGEDTIFLRSLLERGLKGYWAPSAQVFLPFREDEISLGKVWHDERALARDNLIMGVNEPVTPSLRVLLIGRMVQRALQTLFRLLTGGNWYETFRSIPYLSGLIW